MKRCSYVFDFSLSDKRLFWYYYHTTFCSSNYLCSHSSPHIPYYQTVGLQITVPVVSDMSSAGNSIDDCSSGSGGGSPDAAGSEEIGEHIASSHFDSYQHLADDLGKLFES